MSAAETEQERPKSKSEKKSKSGEPSESAKSIKPMDGYEYYTSQDEDGNPIQKLRKKDSQKKKRNKSKSPKKGRTGRTKSPKNRSNNLSKYLNGSGTNMENTEGGRNRSTTRSGALPPRGPTGRNASDKVSPFPIGQQMGRQVAGNSPQFQAAALQQLDNTQISKSKKRTHKK